MGRVFDGLVALFAAAMVHPAAAAELRLLMFEQPGCIYCAKWDVEIAPQYPLTDEGKAAPLSRMHLRDVVPEDIMLQRPPAFTPTFVLLHDGAETGRIEGYPGEDFFWPLLARLILDAGDDAAVDAKE
ncbi:MAG: thioredoxin family protein [Pseudotabrizicola sp.]|uniref:thioredoxin family protein n=1 Tax=Pseudotabrizicola sp. TaxID=2939647 RepID=UPI002728581C|nr:thioredoxin family protein [Pseudotabrizicola sp.]MDO8883612.1 thioredoxin family protein [Pseudotabrizicola sp.]MDP2081265.1 thioredoxin family protein [Pseudotabrizicola sp.]MDZ7576116.1 thioredoxin family protein [Pseudotabrizicola sp.]